jgi:hypothetical protein
MKHNSLSKSKVASVIAAILISSIHVKNESLKNQIVVGAVLSSFLLLGLVLGLNVSYLQPVSASNNEDNDNAEETTNTATTTLNETTTTITISSFTKTMRDLWVDHIVWTRQFIVDSASDLPSLNDTTKRLLKNQEDIGNAIKPYYGDEAGNQLTGLLKGHILIAADLVNAAKAGNDSAAADADQRWSDNADEIAAFLADANPNWNEDGLSDMLHDHLNVTKAEAIARLEGNYTADIEAFDAVHAQAMHMADALSDGIIAQFPLRFKD